MTLALSRDMAEAPRKHVDAGGSARDGSSGRTELVVPPVTVGGRGGAGSRPTAPGRGEHGHFFSSNSTSMTSSGLPPGLPSVGAWPAPGPAAPAAPSPAPAPAAADEA